MLRSATTRFVEQPRLYAGLVAVPLVPFQLVLIGLALSAPHARTAARGIEVVQSLGEALLVAPLSLAVVAVALSDHTSIHRPTVVATWRRIGPQVSRIVASVLLALALVFAGLILILPAIWLGVSFQFVAVVVVVEGIAYRDALTRSFQLVRGRWWAVTLRLVVTFVITGAVPPLIVTGVLDFLAPDASTRAQLVIGLAAELPLTLLALPLQALCLSTLYLDLRRSRGAA